VADGKISDVDYEEAKRDHHVFPSAKKYRHEHVGVKKNMCALHDWLTDIARNRVHNSVHMLTNLLAQRTKLNKFQGRIAWKRVTFVMSIIVLQRSILPSEP